MNKSIIKKISIFAILIILFLISLYLSLFYGLDEQNEKILFTYIRLPAVCKSIIAGSCLALSGMILQAISRNNLADPYLTGLSSGAGLGIVIALSLNFVSYSLFGFIGALIASLIVICLSGFSKFSISKLILIGLSINIFASSIISFLVLTNADKAYAMTLILSGGFSSADVPGKHLWTLFLSALLFCAFFIPKLNCMRIDARLTFESKQDYDAHNLIFVVLSAFLTAVSVYTVGILGFVGIIVPHLSKIIIGNDYRFLFFVNILLGAELLLFSNFLSNNLLSPIQVPLGIVVAFVGAPLFVFFLLRRDFE